MWNYDKIYNRQVKEHKARFEALNKEELIEELLKTRAILYPFYATLSAYDQNTEHRDNIYAESKLFPAQYSEQEIADSSSYVSGNGDLYVYNEETKKYEDRDIPVEELDKHDYHLEESICVGQNERLADEFKLLSITMNVYCGSCYYGAICMADVRRAAKLFGESE